MRWRCWMRWMLRIVREHVLPSPDRGQRSPRPRPLTVINAPQRSFIMVSTRGKAAAASDTGYATSGTRSEVTAASGAAGAHQ